MCLSATSKSIMYWKMISVIIHIDSHSSHWHYMYLQFENIRGNLCHKSGKFTYYVQASSQCDWYAYTQINIWIIDTFTFGFWPFLCIILRIMRYFSLHNSIRLKWSVYHHFITYSRCGSIIDLHLIRLHENLFNTFGEVLRKARKFHNSTGSDLDKWCLFFLSWKSTCLERPLNSVVVVTRLKYSLDYRWEMGWLIITLYNHSCNMRDLPETLIKDKSREISSVRNTHFSYRIRQDRALYVRF